MTIKSDKWIRRMAQEHGMIEPFESEQVRTAHDKSIVSYGLSCYGYDIRCADGFKTFANINSTTVDSKNFDENSFVVLKSDVCVIYACKSCAPVLFFENEEICEVTHKDRGGKYQGQISVTLPRA